jgi:small-conductance mechanosensitive channel
MNSIALFAAAPSAQPSSEVGLSLDDLYAQLESFVRGVIELDPEQAALRAGLTLLVVIVALIILWALRALFKTLASRLAPDEGGEKPAKFKFGGWTMPIARLAIAVGAILVMLQIWGVDLGAVMEGPFGAILGAASRAALIAVVMLGIIEVAQIAVARMFNRVADRARGPRRAAQLRTIAPVVSGVITSVLFVIAAMMVLGQIGIEIGPLLAGAGIIGVAVGFGAQTLVKDFLTGLFLIIEDVVSIGDIAEIGGAAGVVEDMSLRTIKLRALDGTLQVIPYGEAQIIFNRTKGFSNAVFDLGISYSSNILKALELMKTVGDEMQADSELGPLIMQPIEVFGVDALGDSAVMLKGRLRTAPGQQWVVQREYLKRIKLAFDANGIDIPFPHLKLVAPDGAVPISETTTSKQTE